MNKLLTAGLLSVAALGLGIVTAQASPASQALAGYNAKAPGAAQQVHWRRNSWFQRHNHYRPRHWNRRWW
jgi:hypothetical protein